MEKLILIHGMNAGSWTWDKYVPFFEKEGFSVSTPNHAAGIPLDELGRTSILDYVETLENILKEETEKPILIGHSLGGLLVQILAAKGLAKAAVLVQSAPPSDIPVFTIAGFLGFLRTLFTWNWWNSLNKPTFEEIEKSSMHNLSREEKKKYYEKVSSDSGRTIFEIAMPYLDTRKAAQVPKHIDCPLLVIAASGDKIVPQNIGEKLAARYRDVSTLLRFDGYSHWIHLEPGWEKPALEIRDWILNVTGKP